MQDGTKRFPRGGTWYGPTGTIDTNNYGESVGYEGYVDHFTDVDPSDKTVRRSGRDIEVIAVRNVSGMTLLPGYAVTWESGSEGKRVDGYARTTNAHIAGIVDDHLNATNGVRNGDMFWLIVKGPCLCKTPLEADANNVFAIGDPVFALTAATSGATTAGRVRRHNSAGTFSEAETTDGTLFNVIHNGIGRAMSARTTGNTNANILVDLELVK